MYRYIATVVLLLLILTGPILRAQTSCRDFRTQLVQRDMSRVVAVDKTILVTFDWPKDGFNETFALKGVLCGPSREALPGLTIHLVRYEDLRGHPSETSPLSAGAFDDGSARLEEEFELHTSDRGKFSIAGLAPGNYAIVTDWEDWEKPADYVIFDFRLIPGQAIFVDSPKADFFDGS